MGSHLLNTTVPIESLGKTLQRVYGPAISAIHEQRQRHGGGRAQRGGLENAVRT